MLRTGNGAVMITGMLLLLNACSTEPDFEDRTLDLSKVLKNDIQLVIDNGFMMSFDPILHPYEIEQDGFYMVDSPEMLDSLFQNIYYPSPDTPRLDTLFPENGSLLLLDRSLPYCDEVIGHSYAFSEDTVRVTLEIRRWLDRIYDPGIWYFVFPIGVVPEPSP